MVSNGFLKWQYEELNISEHHCHILIIMNDVDQDHRELRELEEGWGETQGRVVDFLLKRWKPLNMKFIQGLFLEF